MWSKVLPMSLLVVVFGVMLGCIPGLNQYLHWNLWYIVPISGLLFGCAAAGLQFGYAFKVNQPMSKVAMAVLVVTAVIGYIGVEYGIYRSISITVTEHESIPDGEYKLSQLIEFPQYMKINLGMKAVEKENGDEIEMGSVGATISYVADIIGCSLGALGILILCREKYPFCIPCQKYKEREQMYHIFLKYDEPQVNELFLRINELKEKGVYKNLTEYLQNLAKTFNDAKGNLKISVDQRFCPVCMEATILGKTYRKNRKDWSEVKDLCFVFISKQGEHIGCNESVSAQEQGT